MKHFLQKDKITILVTDSGIGGVSVANYLYDFFLTNKYYSQVNIVYSDSRINNIGYNSIQTQQEKIKIFSKRMFFLKRKINPDIIFVACNTLSVILNKTKFYKQCEIPIIDILQTSLQQMSNVLNKDKLLFILGTKTTIQTNYYKKLLIEYGYDKSKIINQLCPNLAHHIESSDDYDLNKNITWLVNRIIEKKGNSQIRKFGISFNCTHYFFVMKKFIKQFKNHGYNHIDFICPNKQMTDKFTQLLQIDRFNYCNVNIKRFSFKLNNEKKKRIRKFFYHNIFSDLITK